MDYADLYLTGSMGAQGMFSLVDELNAYTHSIFVDYQLVDQFKPGLSISSLDGLATFMLFTELYLKWTRQNATSQYNALLDNPEIKQLLVELWTRCEWIIENTKDHKNTLNIMADPVLDAVFDVDNYAEIEFLMD